MSLEGFYLWWIVNSDSKQMHALKYGIARLAREHPDKDPREAIVEYFAEAVFQYEQHVRGLKRREKIIWKPGELEALRIEEEQEKEELPEYLQETPITQTLDSLVTKHSEERANLEKKKQSDAFMIKLALRRLS